MSRFSLFFMIFIIASCKHAPQENISAELSHLEQKDKIYLDVDDVQIIDNYVENFAPPHIDYLLNHIPSSLFKKWVFRNLVPSGEKNIIQIFLEDASLIELPSDEKYQYELNFKISLKLFNNLDSSGLSLYYPLDIKIIKSSDKPITPHEDQKFFEEMLDEGVKELKEKLLNIFETKFKNILK